MLSCQLQDGLGVAFHQGRYHARVGGRRNALYDLGKFQHRYIEQFSTPVTAKERNIRSAQDTRRWSGWPAAQASLF
jgi:hypothetical protein